MLSQQDPLYELIALYAENIISKTNAFQILVHQNKTTKLVSERSDLVRKDLDSLKKDIVDTTYDWMISEFRKGFYRKELLDEIKCKFETEMLKRNVLIGS
jgi:hypothetical protein